MSVRTPPPTKPVPLTMERALTALIQGRGSIERARRELEEALGILEHLQRSGAVGWDSDHLRRLADAVAQLEDSGSRLEDPRIHGPARSASAGTG